MHFNLSADGPHSSEATREAADAIAEGVRVLNRATRGAGLEWPSDVHEVLGTLSGAAARLPQALEQMTTWVRTEAAQGRAGEHPHYGVHDGDTDAAVKELVETMRQAAAAAELLHLHLAAGSRALVGMETREP